MAFISDNFDNLKTLQRRERTLLGDMRVAFMDKDLDEFKKLLHRTGYKNDLQFENNQLSTFTFWSRCKFQKFKTSRNLLFERDSGKSLFEEILSTQASGNSNFINLIWTECELWRKRDILIHQNPLGREPIDYVIQSNDDENLFAFLVFDFEQEDEEVVTKSSKNYFLKLKNEQYLRKTGETIFQKFYSIIDAECEEIIFSIMEKLLKEMRQIIDLKGETAIDEVLKMENEKEIYKHKILKLLMSYWKIYSREYSHYKTILSNLSPYYKLILTLKERHEFEFEDLFPKYLDAMKVKHGDEDFQRRVQEDCNSLLEFALRHQQRRAINIIINCPLIDPNQVVIKSHDSAFDSNNVHYVMSKLLEKGYYLGNDNRVPIDWISSQVFEDFLNSRINEDGIYGCQIDYNFLISPEDRQFKIKSDQDENGKLLFNRSMKSLENILNNERLKTSITHPVLSTFINLKMQKYRLIFHLNFFIFMFLYVVPFFLLVTIIPFGKFYRKIFETYGEPIVMEKKIIYTIFGLTRTQVLSAPFYACIIATAYLAFREALQLFIISERKWDYFKKRSNQFEIMLIILSIVILWGMKTLTVTQIKTYLAIPSAFLIIFATAELLFILPYPSMSIYMIMLKQVTKTFTKFFTIFILVIIAFTFSFCVVLKPPTISAPSPWKQLKRDWNNSVALMPYKEQALMFVNTLQNALEDNETVFRNFENPFTSFQKTLMMLSGEFEIEPYTLDSVPKQVLFLLFVFTSFVLFNLINGLAISDVAQLKDHAEFLNLKQQVRNIAESESILCDIYWKLHKNSSESFWRRSVMIIMALLINKHPYIHKLDNLCIDFKKKIAKYEIHQKRIHVLRTQSGNDRKYWLDDEILKKLSTIVESRQNEVEGVNEKVKKLQTEIKVLRQNLQSQHEAIMKSLGQLKNQQMDIK